MPWFVGSEVRWKNYLENIALAISAIDLSVSDDVVDWESCQGAGPVNTDRLLIKRGVVFSSWHSAEKQLLNVKPAKMNEWGHSGTVTNEEVVKEEKLPSRLCFLMHASMIAVQLGTNWQQHPPNLWRVLLPTIPRIVTWNATISLTLFPLRWSDRGGCRLGGSHRCSRGTKKQLKNRHDPLTEIHISSAGSGSSCCHRWCRKTEKSQRRVSSEIFISDQQAFDAAEPTSLRAPMSGSSRLLRLLPPPGRLFSSLFNQSHIFLPRHNSHKLHFAAFEMTNTAGIFPGFSRE